MVSIYRANSITHHIYRTHKHSHCAETLKKKLCELHFYCNYSAKYGNNGFQKLPLIRKKAIDTILGWILFAVCICAWVDILLVKSSKWRFTVKNSTEMWHECKINQQIHIQQQKYNRIINRIRMKAISLGILRLIWVYQSEAREYATRR